MLLICSIDVVDCWAWLLRYDRVVWATLDDEQVEGIALMSKGE